MENIEPMRTKMKYVRNLVVQDSPQQYFKLKFLKEFGDEACCGRTDRLPAKYSLPYTLCKRDKKFSLSYFFTHNFRNLLHIPSEICYVLSISAYSLQQVHNKKAGLRSLFVVQLLGQLSDIRKIWHEVDATGSYPKLASVSFLNQWQESYFISNFNIVKLYKAIQLRKYSTSTEVFLFAERKQQCTSNMF